LATLTFSQPEIAKDGQIAQVKMSMVSADVRPYLESKMTYEIFLKEAYRAEKSGQPLPSLEIIQSTVNGWILQRGLDLEEFKLSRSTPPVLKFAKTSEGWRLNLSEFFAQKS